MKADIVKEFRQHAFLVIPDYLEILTDMLKKYETTFDGIECTTARKNGIRRPATLTLTSNTSVVVALGGSDLEEFHLDSLLSASSLSVVSRIPPTLTAC